VARPTKEGLDYFPLDVDMDQDDKVYLLEAEFGLKGFAIAIKLFMKIYDSGYYIKWREREAKIFAHKNSIDVNVVNNVVNVSINEGLFDKELYDEYGVLTSSGIQKRFFKACTRRKEVEYNPSFILVDVNDYDNLVNVNKNPNLENDDANNKKQSKVKKSKVKESKDIKHSSDSESPNDDHDPEEDKSGQEDNKPKFDEDSKPFKAACYLRDKIEQNNPKAVLPDKIPKDIENWAVEMDRLHRLGPVGAKESDGKGYNWQEIAQIIDWCQQDNFWKSNILSAGKLREKIVTLENQMKSRASQGGTGNGENGSESRESDTECMGKDEGARLEQKGKKLLKLNA